MILGIIALVAYLAATIGVLIGLWHRRPGLADLGVWLAVPALAAHAVYLAERISAPAGGWDMNILNALSLVSAVIVALILLATPRRQLINTGVVVFPGAALWLALQLAVTVPPVVLSNVDWLTELHVACSLIAYGTLSIAALTALLVAFQDRILRHHGPARLLEVLPPLAWLETLMFRLILAGWAVLTVSLITGGLYIESLLAQHLVHKAVLSVLSWIVFGVLLFGRWRYGWRGRTALSLALAGMGFLLLAYFGSKLVLEILLSENLLRAGS